MAKINLYTQVHADAYNGIGNPYTDADAVTVSANQVTILWDSATGYKTVFTGNFELTGNPNDPVSGGTITGIREFEEGQLLWQATELSLDVNHYLSAAQSGDATSLFEMALSGNDSVWADDTPDILKGFAGDDFIDGNGGNDAIDGGAGNDVLLGAGGNDNLWGGSGNDRLEGEWGADVLRGGDGNDRLLGGDGGDWLEGGLGSDLLKGGSGADTMFGGADNDTYFVDDAGDVVDETQGGSDAGGIDKVVSTVDFELGAFQENLFLSGAAFGGVGNDLDNLIKGNDERNELIGNAGDDTLKGLRGSDRLYGGAGDDSLDGGIGNDRLVGNSGSDILRGQSGDDRILGGTGTDWVSGDAGNDVLFGQADNDTLYGGYGADRLVGGAGADKLVGDAGSDILIGNVGRDILNVGDDTERDIVKFNHVNDSRVEASDRVYNFDRGEDVIDLRAIDANTAQASDQEFVFSGSEASANSVWYHEGVADNLMLRGDVDGDATADFQIVIVGQSALDTGDILL